MTVTRLEHVTPDVLTELLGATVTDIEARPIGTGQVGATYRLTLTGENGLPTLVGKFAAADEFTRNTAIAQGSYIRETGFYRGLARPDLPVPHARHVGFDAASHDFALLLDDLTHHRGGDQLVPLEASEALAAVDALARIHRSYWGDEKLLGQGYLPGSREYLPAPLDPLYEALWPAFLERYGARVSGQMRAIGEAYRGRCEQWAAPRPGPKTLVHGDYRHDNLLFGPDGDVVVVDWQTAAIGSGATDLAYFAGTSLAREWRRAHEVELFERWLSGLRRDDLDRDQLWRVYRRDAFAGFLMGVAAAMIVGRTDRGDAMFLCMCERAAAMVEDHDATALI